MSEFGRRAAAALADRRLHVAIERTTGNAIAKRAAAVDAWPGFANARQRGAAIRDHTVANLGFYLERFEAAAQAAGTTVHWARDADEACRIIVDICRAAGARSVARSKSMLGEEIGLPHALEAAGIERIETDLAEHIIQLAGERPSHIVWPAMHKTRDDVSALFRRHHREPHETEEIAAMVQSARRHLRQAMLGADVGISGANFLIADTGQVVTVTNEGNAELSLVPPRVHIVTAGIEKVVATHEHAVHLLRLLARSATGAALTQYTSFFAGPRRVGDRDGPEEMHVVLVDNGRSAMRNNGLAEMLRCIRCGACMNHCVVFRQIGGHAYGGAYPGPMGAVLAPALAGLTDHRDPVQACTMNGRCREVCPVNIPLPTLLRGWRNRSWREGLEPLSIRAGIALWNRITASPRLYRLISAAAARVLAPWRRQGGGWLAKLPFARGWTQHRDLPRPASGGTFLHQWDRGRR